MTDQGTFTVVVVHAANDTSSTEILSNAFRAQNIPILRNRSTSGTTVTTYNCSGLYDKAQEILRGLQKEKKMDGCILSSSQKHPKVKLAVFDMDSTLIHMETIDELAKVAGSEKRVAEVTERAMRGEIDFREALTERVATLKGVDAKTAYRYASEKALRVISPGALTLSLTLQKMGVKCVIVSGGFVPVCSVVARHLGIDEFYANELEVDEKTGKFTGRLVPGSPIVDSAFKASVLERDAKKMGLSKEETAAIGDGANDIPMMQLAGYGIAYCAKPLVQEKASHRLNLRDISLLLHYFGIPERDWVTSVEGQRGRSKL